MTSLAQVSAQPGFSGLALPLAELTEDQLLLAGHKAINLGKMLAAGLPVPSGFVLSTGAFHRWLEGAPGAAQPLEDLQRAASGNADELPAAARNVAKVMASAQVPESVVDALREQRLMLNLGFPLAVRSSSTIEDSPVASFAGQYVSFLNVQDEHALLDAVRNCWLSAFAERALKYRARNNLLDRAAAMAVIVQAMFPAEKAGVLFSADPLTGDSSRIVIEAVWGLGDKLVAGKANPERLVLDRGSLVVLKGQAAPSSDEVRLPEEISSGADQRIEADHSLDPPGHPIAQSQSGQGCLDRDLGARLVGLSTRVERLFGGAQDIEWAARDGQVVLLQARPVTSLPQKSSADNGVWSRANVCEGFPDVATPMTWSVVEDLLLKSTSSLLRFWGIDADRNPWLGLFEGRIYINLGIAKDLLGGSRWVRESDLEAWIGGRVPPLPPPAAESQPLYRVRCLVRCMRHPVLMAYGVAGAAFQNGRAVLGRFRRVAEELDHLDLRSVPDEFLADLGTGIRDRVFPEVASPAEAAYLVGCLAGGLGCSLALMAVSRLWLADAQATIAKRLLAGTEDMASARAGLDLRRLAESARNCPEIANAILGSASFSEARERLQPIDAGRTFLGRWQEFMALHGHRGRGEADVHSPRWAEMPDYLMEQVRCLLRTTSRHSPLQVQSDRLHDRQDLFASTRARLRHPLRRWIFSRLVERGRRGLAFRENVKNEAVRAVAFLHRAFQEAGARLVNRGILGQADDVFFLTLPELSAALGGSPKADFAGKVRARRLDYAKNRSLNPPLLIVGRGQRVESNLVSIPAETTCLRGLAVSPGIATGKARVVLEDDQQSTVLPGEVLVAPWTDPGWTPYFLNAAGIVVDIGGQLSHGSVVAREYGIPAVVNVGPATKLIRTGQVLEVDGNRGTVKILS